jgi:hypothetical protein
LIKSVLSISSSERQLIRSIFGRPITDQEWELMNLNCSNPLDDDEKALLENINNDINIINLRNSIELNLGKTYTDREWELLQFSSYINLTNVEKKFIEAIKNGTLTEEQQKFIESGRCLKVFKHRYYESLNNPIELKVQNAVVELTYHFDFGDYGIFDDDSDNEPIIKIKPIINEH